MFRSIDDAELVLSQIQECFSTGGASEALDCPRAAVRCAVRTNACHCGVFKISGLQQEPQSTEKGWMLVSYWR